MRLHNLGEITLSVSSLVYIIWLWPQLWLNFKRKSIEGLSFWFHILLLLGYCGDLVYGFGLHMQWQYRMVTCAGLLALIIQHGQMWYYGVSIRKAVYWGLTLLVVFALLAGVMVVLFQQDSRRFYNTIGMISTMCYLIYLLPQVWENFKRKSTEGLSHWFIYFSVFLGGCDLASAIIFHWDWPSFVGPSVGMLIKLMLLIQLFNYRGNACRKS